MMNKRIVRLALSLALAFTILSSAFSVYPLPKASAAVSNATLNEVYRAYMNHDTIKSIQGISWYYEGTFVDFDDDGIPEMVLKLSDEFHVYSYTHEVVQVYFTHYSEGDIGGSPFIGVYTNQDGKSFIVQGSDWRDFDWENSNWETGELIQTRLGSNSTYSILQGDEWVEVLNLEWMENLVTGEETWSVNNNAVSSVEYIYASISTIGTRDTESQIWYSGSTSIVNKK